MKRHAAFVAQILTLSQEHGPDSQVVFGDTIG